MKLTAKKLKELIKEELEESYMDRKTAQAGTFTDKSAFPSSGVDGDVMAQEKELKTPEQEAEDKAKSLQIQKDAITAAMKRIQGMGKRVSVVIDGQSIEPQE